MSELTERAKALIETKVCRDCGVSECGWEEYDRFSRAYELLPELIEEAEKLGRWQREVADALGISEGPGMETGGVWFCADADEAARYARESVAALQEALQGESGE
ncbi:hypothetical protein [Mycobacteroides immunogenum]|uniref:Uncharacterized protein n=1 Tax=Mycobacteroides immunogenum TaxID=83262 RepID=A0A7V8RXC4_9MYCO|nr:hypothetical protein [Mycobacteroides immunogenum]KPG13764.1 hypothetical protein AN909_05845 [Mycobacteroides immunogenum]KPG14244.1 hypothetical protein AN908_06550 [Mycobacteroides immunogenum]KPG14322.1 hypothetical protein AN908_07075 [Mycobacteroides immunogenum]KPG17478.1 hypothetical protein AN910_05070 [Mycobacteroides immunogenum]KPG23937.1 hypothetical protein AN911_00085 [Mycobacteroides immunogenum]